MKKIILCLAAACGLQAGPSSLFAMTPEEMVFASKLSDQNRRTFCYEFSFQERMLCLEACKKENVDLSADSVVEQVASAFSSEESSPR